MSKTADTVSVGMKFDGRNFPVWSRLILIAVGSRETLEHLEGDEDPPKPTDPKFKAWQAADYTVFSWLIQNMEQKIVVQFAQHQTAKAMWKSLVTTFGVRADPLQVYDLEIKTAKITQGNKTLEEYYSDLQNLWVNIDARKPCPYDCCDKAINTYRKETERKRLYQFLAGLDDKFEVLRREILKDSSEPSAEDAFGIIKQEEVRTGIWNPTATNDHNQSVIGTGFGARHGGQLAQYQPRGPPPPPHHQGPPSQPSRGGPPNRKSLDKSKLFCTHCGMTKHTKETCFKLVGFPEWWEDGHKLNRNSTGKGRMAVGRDENSGPFAPTGSQEATFAGTTAAE